ncbi:MAG: hypothetical protein C0506_08745 [Anaerolinea sp.]|nr:hypothetical protein [Anaerolinea sp.]
MPMSQHRAALAAILVAVVATLALTAGPAIAAPADSSPLAAKALGYDGTWQGECWQFVKRVVREATGNEMGFDYRQGFFDAGATEVTAANAQPGDIIQIASDRNTSADADYPGLHTSIVLENLGNGSFHVIDSNQNFDGMVGHRESYDPFAAAARWGLQVHIYRIPSGPGAPKLAAPLPAAKPATVPTPPLPGQVLAAGDSAVVYTPGDILNLRSGPGRDFDVTARLAHGTALTVISAPVRNGGFAWVKVSTPSGEGWVAADFLSKEVAKPATTSGAGAVAPVLTFRTFIPLTSND